MENQKLIAKVEPMFNDHRKVTLEDGSAAVLHRGAHLDRTTYETDPKVGDMWPPAEVAEVAEVVEAPKPAPAPKAGKSKSVKAKS